jgi:hypothetical protein
LDKLPSAGKGAAEVAKLAIGISGAVAGIFLPGAGVIGPIANYAIERFIKGPEKILIEELKRGNFEILDDERAAAFVPMAYKFFEAAKEGEYEHNLRILAELLTMEMKAFNPDASAFARLSRRVEGLTRIDLTIIAMIETYYLSKNQDSAATTEQKPVPPWVSAEILGDSQVNSNNFEHRTIQESLSDLAARGLLTADGSIRWDKSEEYYLRSSSFLELARKARRSLDEATSGTTT